ncbi:MAG: M28 family metallopeptidase [Actinomycetota bacterium]|nr:M28 family metallopeptidase [Actinomycetota bacterium]
MSDAGRLAVTAAGEGPRADGDWTRLGDVDVVIGPAAAGVSERAARTAVQPMLVTQLGRLFQRRHPDVPVLVDKGRYLVVDTAGHEIDPCGEGACGYALMPLPANEVVFERRTGTERVGVGRFEALVGGVSPEEIAAANAHLASFPTRHALSGAFAAAADWAAERLASQGYDVRLDPVAMPGGETANVVAERAGQGTGDGALVVVCAHLDSVNLDGGPDAPAPGADDNGSGSAGLLEIARVLAEHPVRDDLRLLLFGGEEEGLWGSRRHVGALGSADRARISAVINMDMIGTVNTPERTVLIEGGQVSTGLIDIVATAASTYTSLAVQTSLNPFNSDHVPFIEAGIPAVLTIEGTDSANQHIHSDRDTIDHVDSELATEIVRMNVAATAAALGSA